MNYGYIPVPRGRTVRSVAPAQRKGLAARLWARLMRRPMLMAYATYAACAAQHPHCDVWRVPLETRP